MEYEKFENNINMINRFSNIKLAILNTHNPFKNPSFVSKQYLNEKEKDS